MELINKKELIELISLSKEIILLTYKSDKKYAEAFNSQTNININMLEEALKTNVFYNINYKSFKDNLLEIKELFS